MIDFLLVKLSGFILTCGMSRITAQRTNYWPLSVKKQTNSAPDKNRFILQTDQTAFFSSMNERYSHNHVFGTLLGVRGSEKKRATIKSIKPILKVCLRPREQTKQGS